MMKLYTETYAVVILDVAKEVIDNKFCVNLDSLEKARNYIKCAPSLITGLEYRIKKTATSYLS